MKKVLIILCIISTLIVGSGCSEEIEPFDKSISYKQVSMRVGVVNNHTVTVSGIVVESPYLADGIPETTHEECKITIKSTVDISTVTNLRYKFTHGDETIEGEFRYDKLRNVLYASTTDINHAIDMESITIYDDTSSYDVSLDSVINKLITVDDVIRIAKTEYEEDIRLNTIDGVYQKEVYIKYITDHHQEDTVYYWYVALISRDHTFSALLINPANGDVIAKRK